MAGLSLEPPAPPSVPSAAEEQLGLALLGLGAGACVLAVMTGSVLISIACVVLFGTSLWLQARHLIHPGMVMMVLSFGALAVPARFVVSFLFFPVTMTIGLMLVIAWLGQRLVVHQKLARTDLLIFGLLGAALLSQAFGMLRSLSAAEDAATNRRLLELLAMCGVGLFTADSARSREAVERILLGVVAGAGVAGLIGLIQWASGGDFTSSISIPGLVRNPAADAALAQVFLRNDLARVYGTTLHPIELGVLLAAVLPIGLHFLRRDQPHATRLIASASVAVAVLAIPLTLSRSAVLGVLVAVLALIPWLTWRSRLHLLVALISAVLIAAAVFPAATTVMREIIAEPAADDGSLAARTSDYTLIEQYVSEKPVFGRGYGSFVPTQYFWVDNQYLRTLLEAGTIGLIALLSLYLGSLAIAAGVRRRALAPRDRSMSQSLFASLAVCVVAAATFDAL